MKTRIHGFLVILLSLGFVFLNGCNQTDKELSLDFEKYSLENGLNVILHKDTSDPIVAVAIQYHVGSNREKPGKTGFAHLFEHMMFQQSENIGQDEFFPDVAGKIQVDVGNRVQGLVQEAAQEEVGLHRVDVREADEIADDGGNRRSASPSWWEPRVGPGRLAADTQGHVPRQVHDVPVDQEEARKAVPLHQTQFFFQALFGLRPFLPGPGGTTLRASLDTATTYAPSITSSATPRMPNRIPLIHQSPAGFGQDLDSRLSLSRAFEIGKFVAQILGDVESSAALGNAKCVGDGIGSATEAVGHLPGRCQVKEGIGASHRVGVVQGGPVADGDQHVLETMPLRPVIVDIPRGHHRNDELVGEAGQPLVPLSVSLHAVLLKLHVDVPGTERIEKASQQAFSGCHTVLKRRPQGASAASREQDDAPYPLRIQEDGEGEKRISAVLRFHVSLGQEAAQVGVPLGGLGQEGEVEAHLRGDWFDGSVR